MNGAALKVVLAEMKELGYRIYVNTATLMMWGRN